jgi:hypothetical protein
VVVGVDTKSGKAVIVDLADLVVIACVGHSHKWVCARQSLLRRCPFAPIIFTHRRKKRKERIVHLRFQAALRKIPSTCQIKWSEGFEVRINCALSTKLINSNRVVHFEYRKCLFAGGQTDKTDCVRLGSPLEHLH